MDGRAERLAANELLFREVNERIAAVGGHLSSGGGPEFLCECGHEDCVLPLSMSLGEYEAVRSERSHFAVAPGHEEPTVERVVGRTDRYLVVEKVAEAGDLAEEADPRSNSD